MVRDIFTQSKNALRDLNHIERLKYLQTSDVIDSIPVLAAKAEALRPVLLKQVRQQ